MIEYPRQHSRLVLENFVLFWWFNAWIFNIYLSCESPQTARFMQQKTEMYFPLLWLFSYRMIEI